MQLALRSETTAWPTAAPRPASWAHARARPVQFGQRQKRVLLDDPGARIAGVQWRAATGGHQTAFVDSLRHASGYILGHHHTTWVVVLPFEVLSNTSLLAAITKDLRLLQGQGIRLVLALGTPVPVATPAQPCSSGSLQEAARRSAAQDAAAAQMELQRFLAQGHDMKMIRRHTRTFNSAHSKPAVHAVTGNWVSAKAKGIVQGQDLSAEGQVRFIEADAISFQLSAGNVVLLSSIGFGTHGQALHCDIYSVATAAAASLQADKLICLTVPSMLPFQLPSWLSVRDTRSLLNTLAAEQASLPPVQAEGGPHRATAGEVRLWQECRLPQPLIAACAACGQGVKRTHLVDASMDGALLLEMYTDSGNGTMVSHDFHEELMRPFELEGVLLARTADQIQADLANFFVVDSREDRNKVVGCAMIKPLDDADGHTLGELGAFCTHPSCQGAGIGDSLLEWLEHEAQTRGMTRLVLLTTRTGAWFEERGYLFSGPAFSSTHLPPSRRAQVDAKRNAMLYVKDLVDEPGVALLNTDSPYMEPMPILANNIVHMHQPMKFAGELRAAVPGNSP